MPRRFPDASGPCAFKDVHQFGDLLSLVLLTARDHRMRHAMLDMVFEDCVFDTLQRGARGSKLRDQVDAVAVGFDHAVQALDLADNAVQPLQTVRLDVGSHNAYIPLQGIVDNA